MKTIRNAPYLPLDMAEKAAMAQCIADGYNVSVAAVERSGSTKVLLKVMALARIR